MADIATASPLTNEAVQPLRDQVRGRVLAPAVLGIDIGRRWMRRSGPRSIIDGIAPVQAVALAQLALRCQSGPPPREQPA